MKPSGWCLVSPSGKFIAETFEVDQDICWEKSFDFLYETKKWMRPYGKMWNESIAAAEKRGWVMTKVELRKV